MPVRFRPLAPTALLGLLLLLAGCGTMNAVSGFFGDRISFTEPQLQRRLDRSFPREFDKLGGLVSATLSHPRLTLAEGDDRLRLDFDIGVSAVGAGNVANGRFAIASRLRYDPATQGLHLDDPEVLSVELPGSGSVMRGGTRELINTVLAEYARQEPLYRIDSDVLDRLPRGKRIGATLIEHGKIVVKLDGY